MLTTRAQNSRVRFLYKTKQEERSDHRSEEDNVMATNENAVPDVAQRVRDFVSAMTLGPSSEPTNALSTSNVGRVSAIPNAPTSSSAIPNAGGVVIHVSGKSYFRFLRADYNTRGKHEFCNFFSLRGKVNYALMLNFNTEEGVYQLFNLVIERHNIFLATSTETKLTNLLSSTWGPANPTDYIYAIQENKGTFLIVALEEGVKNSYKMHTITTSPGLRRIGVDLRVALDGNRQKRHRKKPLILLSDIPGHLELLTNDNEFPRGSFAVFMTPDYDRRGLVCMARALLGTENARIAFL